MAARNARTKRSRPDEEEKTETERRNSLDVTNADEKVKVRRRIITTAICPMHSYFSWDLNFVRIELLKLTNLLNSSLRWNTDKLTIVFFLCMDLMRLVHICIERNEFRFPVGTPSVCDGLVSDHCSLDSTRRTRVLECLIKV